MTGYHPPPHSAPFHQTRSMYHHGLYSTHNINGTLDIRGQTTSNHYHHPPPQNIQHHPHQQQQQQQQQPQQQQQQPIPQHPAQQHNNHLMVSRQHLRQPRQIPNSAVNSTTTNLMPLNSNGEPVKLPENLEFLPRADHFPRHRHRWNTNEEIAAILISFEKHSEWQSKEVKTRPKSGSMLLYSRKKVRYRRDGYCWKKRKDGKTTREDHMKLKVQGTECIYGCYVHSAILPTFHRRCYWLLQNPDIVLVHYLNVPYPDDSKMATLTPNLASWGDKKEWTKEELVNQLKPMLCPLVFSEDENGASSAIEESMAETVETIVTQLMEKQRMARHAALVKQLECGCPGPRCADSKSCSHPIRRISAAKKMVDTKQENAIQVSSSTSHVFIGSRHIRGPTSGFLILNGQQQTYLCQTQPDKFLLQQQQQQQIKQQQHQQQQQQQQQQEKRELQMLQKPREQDAGPMQVETLKEQQGQILRTNDAANCTQKQQLLKERPEKQQQELQKQREQQEREQREQQEQIKTIAQQHNQHAQQQQEQQLQLSEKGILERSVKIEQQEQHQQQHLQREQQEKLQHQLLHSELQKQSSDQPDLKQEKHISQSQHENNHQLHSQSISQSMEGITENRLQLPDGEPEQPSHNQQLHDLPNPQKQREHQLANKIQEEQDNQHRQEQEQQLQEQQLQQQLQQQQQQANQQKEHLEQLAQLQQQEQQIKASQFDPDASLLNHKNMESLMFLSEKHLESIYDGMHFLSVQQNNPAKSPSKMKHLLSADTLPCLDEKLDFSEDDIHKTLNANVPTNKNHHKSLGDDINSIDYIENCCNLSKPMDNEDDVFVNLEGFDLLIELPDTLKHNMQSSPHDEFKTVNQMMDQNSKENNVMLNISEYSPEWAYAEGGEKVLVTGPWDLNTNYTILFDSFPVPTTIVQRGVLRCYCPAHEVGSAIIQVACDGFVVSNSVIFEYKPHPSIENICESSKNDSLYKCSLYNRFEMIDERLKVESDSNDMNNSFLFNQPNFEEQLVIFCQEMTAKTWNSLALENWTVGYRRMSLLHLASALGFSKLVRLLLRWRSDNPSFILDTEIDALSQDSQGYTPLMWASSRGHFDTAIVLYKWNHNALNVKNNLQLTPIEVADANGHTELADELKRLEEGIREKEVRKQSDVSGFTDLNASSSVLLQQNEKCFFEISQPFAPPVATPEDIASKGAMVSGRNDSKCSFGVGESLFYTKDFLNDLNHSQRSSPTSMSSLTSINSIPSHDGVFLRPGTVTSPHGTRLSKRTSVDSGINVDVKSSLLPLTKYLNDSQIIYGGLDVSDGFDPTDPHDDDDFHQYSNLLSPLCKMDFSLCEVGAPSAIKNKHSREDTFIDQGRDRKLSDTLLVDSDSRVLSLAEQIIAAMPEKIKNESDEMMLLDSPVTDALNMDAPGMGSFTDSFMEPLLDSDGSFGHKFTFEFSDHNYRYNEVSTPCSSLSPDSSGPLQSPSSISIPNDPPSPTPTTQDFSEFLQASNFASKPFETDFSKLTLTDREQRELYEAARCIQKAYRSYKGRKYEEEQKKERSAAIVIQNCYRRYKQYAYYRQMTHAAVVIQNGYRSYCEHKRFKNTHNEDEPIEPSNSDTDLDLKNFQKHCQYDQQSSNPKELSPSGPLKRTYSQRTQNQAARKIQQFMRQSKVKLQKERDERGKLLHLQLVDCPQSAPFPELPNRPQSDNTNSENQEPLTSL